MDKPFSPVFSVITVCYNAKATLEPTIQSVLSQTYPSIEYILIDGASDDGTDSIIARYHKQITQVISEPDEGLYHAMNKGIRLATGDYLCFLNAGDSFHKENTLQRIVDKLEKEYSLDKLPDVIYGETALIDSQRQYLRMRRLSAPATLTWRSFKQGMLVCHQAFLAKRELAEDYDLQYRFSADFDWCIRILKRAQNCYFTHLILIDYLAQGQTTQNQKASLVERFRIMGKYYGWVSTLLHHLWFVVRWVIKRGAF